MVKINGHDVPDIAGKTVAQMLETLGYDKRRIAVEASGQIVSKRYFDERVISDGEIIEIVSFVGGG